MSFNLSIEDIRWEKRMVIPLKNTEIGSSTCCSSPLDEWDGIALWKSLALFLGLVGIFIVSNYWFGGFLNSHLNVFSQAATDSLSFFISHSIGLLGLLAAITTFAVFIRSFINADKVRNHMEKVNTLRGHGVAAGIGMATPFCSCSAVPVFTGFVRAGVPVSQAMSFLVASPLVNEIAVIMLATTVGWGIAGAYAGMGFAIAVGAGISLRRYAKPSLTEVTQVKSLNLIDPEGKIVKPSLQKRANAALLEARDTVKTTYVFILIGVGVGSLIYGWVPTSAIQTISAWGPVFGVLAATAIGVPLYSGIATVIPIITALSEKGLPMGTLLAFAMSVTALSFPEALLLRKVMKPKLLAAYFGVVTLGIVLVGIIFNLALGY
ncbi:MAG: permease [Candidatus Planktophila sp.]|nr:permease [Candidatus Planktophila sp.]